MNLINYKVRLKMIWHIIRDRQVVIISTNKGNGYYNWDTRSTFDAYAMCLTVSNDLYKKHKKEREKFKKLED